MNVHIFYVSLLVIAAGFIGYLKLELDSNLEKFENGKQALSKNLAQLKETIKRTEGELNKCKKSLSSFEPLLKEVEEAKKKLSDVTQSSSTCTQAKENIEVEMQSLKNNLQKETSDKTGLAQKLASCEAQKNEASLKANQEAANSKACHDLKNQCQQEKATFEAEQIKWKKQVEDTTAAWQSEKNNLIKATGDLQACQQNAAALQNQRDQLAQTSNLCVGDKQKCEADKVACLQALEAERVVKQQLQQQLQQHQQRVQQQQQVPPQQQQVPPQQQQQVPPQQQQVPPQQQQQVPPQQQQAPPQKAQP